MKCEIGLKLPISDRAPEEEEQTELAQGDGAEQGPSSPAANSGKLQHTVQGRGCQSSCLETEKSRMSLMLIKLYNNG